MPQKSSSTPIVRKKFLLVFFGLLTLVAIFILILELTNTTHIFHKKKVPSTIPVAVHGGTVTKSSNSQTNPASSAAPAQNSPQSTKQIPFGSRSSGNTQALVQPYGSFVSNHLPGQSGSTTKEESVCNTTPGAACYIQFTNSASGVTTKLPSQTTGNDGSTIWSWDAQTLTPGEWQITAVANLNGQTTFTTDTVKLDIQ